jgi:hypothetical protein
MRAQNPIKVEHSQSIFVRLNKKPAEPIANQEITPFQHRIACWVNQA